MHQALQEPEMQPVMDVELRNNSAKEMLERIYQVANKLGYQGGREAIYYSNLSFTQGYLGSPEWLSKFPLWIANYTFAEQPAMPSIWDDWTFWQWSADGNHLGPTYGAESDSIDLNRYAGTIEDLRAFAGIAPPKAENPFIRLLRAVCKLVQ